MRVRPKKTFFFRKYHKALNSINGLLPEFASLKDLKEENSKEFKYWQYITIYIPVFIIGFSLILYGIIYFDSFFSSNKAERLNDFKAKVFNGSLPLTCVGILVSSLFILFRYDTKTEERAGLSTLSNARIKLLVIIIIMLLVSWGLYFVENFLMPAGLIGTMIFFIISLAMLFCSIYLSANIFFMQDTFVNNALNIKSSIQLTSKNLKGQRLTKLTHDSES